MNLRIKKKNLIFEQRVKSQMPVPKEVKQLYNLFKKNGFKLYIVGGAVRDTLLDKPIKDYDLATDAPPEKVEDMLKRAKIRTIGTGAQFGVINAYIGDEEYEIATFREDVYNAVDNDSEISNSNGYSDGKGDGYDYDPEYDNDEKLDANNKPDDKPDGRRPNSVIYSTIENDVKRRDLTINALFYDIETQEIVDLVGGMEDIKNGVVRTVGDAGERFGEDRLRILRAIRFAGRMSSKLDPAIDKALRKDNSLEGISSERIRDEFLKGIKSAKSIKHFLNLLERYGLLDSIFNGIDLPNKTFVENRDPIVVMAMILKDVNFDKLGKQLNKLTYSIDEIRKITFLIAFYKTMDESNFYTLKKLHKISRVEDSTFKDFGELTQMDIGLISKFVQYQLGSFRGQDVAREFGLENGPELGEKIKELETQAFYNG